MKIIFKTYIKIWILAIIILFTVLFGAYPKFSNYTVSYDSRSWAAFLLIIAEFIGNLVITYYALKADILIKKFHNLPLATVNFSALTIMLIVSLVFIPNSPTWVAIIICTIIFAFNAMVVIKTSLYG